MRYIRRVDNPLIIKASGFVGPGGLGEFDPEIYEEVEGELPEGGQKEEPVDLAQILATFWETQDIDLQAMFAPLRSAVKTELELGNVLVAKRIIELASVPPELEAAREQILALFGGV